MRWVFPLIFVLVGFGCSLIVDPAGVDMETGELVEGDSCSESGYFVDPGSDSTDCSDVDSANETVDSGSGWGDGSGSVDETGTGVVDTGSGSVSTSVDTSSSGTITETSSASESVSDSASESVSESAPLLHLWCDDRTGLCWELFGYVEDIPEKAMYYLIEMRCKNLGMRVPTSPEVRTLVDNCDGLFEPGCEYDQSTYGYSHCRNGYPHGIYDEDRCRGKRFLHGGVGDGPEEIITSSVPDLGLNRHEVWFLSKDEEVKKFPEVGLKLNTVEYNTICVK
jgi:hypothetical protein